MKILLLIVATFLPANVFAHGLATTFTQQDGNYIIVFEYDETGNITAAESSVYGFEILDPITKESLTFDKTFIRFKKVSGPVILAANLVPTKDAAGFTTSRISSTISDPGDYEVEAIFYRGQERITDSKFNFKVDPEPKAESTLLQNYLWLLMLIGGVALGSLITYLLQNKKAAR